MIIYLRNRGSNFFDPNERIALFNQRSQLFFCKKTSAQWVSRIERDLLLTEELRNFITAYRTSLFLNDDASRLTRKIGNRIEPWPFFQTYHPLKHIITGKKLIAPNAAERHGDASLFGCFRNNVSIWSVATGMVHGSEGFRQGAEKISGR